LTEIFLGINVNRGSQILPILVAGNIIFFGWGAPFSNDQDIEHFCKKEVPVYLITFSRIQITN